jgi:hypothetical protein
VLGMPVSPAHKHTDSRLPLGPGIAKSLCVPSDSQQNCCALFCGIKGNILPKK